MYLIIYKTTFIKHTSSINVWNPTKKIKILNDIQTLTLTCQKICFIYTSLLELFLKLNLKIIVYVF